MTNTKHRQLVRETVKPSMIKGAHYYDTFGKCELEIVARNIVFCLQKNGDEWRPFSAKDYARTCTHTVTDTEIGLLNLLVQRGALSKSRGLYEVTNSFIETVREYITMEDGSSAL